MDLDAQHFSGQRRTRLPVNLVVGPGDAEGVTIGPLINEQGVAKVERLVSDAVGAGAELVAGGVRHDLGGSFYEPTVLSDVTHDMRVMQEETFGPILPIMRVRTSPSKPFITDRMTMSAATPNAIPSREISVIKDTNRVRRFALR